MKKILIFVIAIAMSVAHGGAAVRDGNATQRTTNASGTTTQKRISTVVKDRSATPRSSVVASQRTTSARTTSVNTISEKSKTNVVNRTAPNAVVRTALSGIVSRAATTQPQSITETRTGAAYESCKTAYFTCMDQFCALKNDDYRRCSCSNRVYDMDKARDKLTQAGEQLTVFNENLDVVGLTAEQALAMRTASEGESALSKDTSASKALLQAIMNSISGGDTTVGGKYSDLNTVNVSYDLSTSFGADTNQLIAMYNGQELYTNVYSQCRHAVAADCSDAALQRAINAYLMAIEQDCNTVQTAIEEKQRQTKSAIRESSAMLDLARVENRQKHNSDDLTSCVNNVEAAILSEEVCGANYHKCLDNGEYIDISTGAPIVGIVKFYELGNMLKFAPDVDAANQQLADRPSNRQFVSAFESRTKKFAKPALDKCTEIADTVWAEYLNKAMLSIYYAQQSKVNEIKQGCFDFITQCYEHNEGSITAAMSSLIGTGTTILAPDKIALSTQMCTEYVESCNNMFENNTSGDIVKQYVNNRQTKDTLAACRAVVKQCFDKYGGQGYENFYYPYSGLFDKGLAGDWFTLYDHTTENTNQTQKYLSPCANQLSNIDACNDPNIIEEAFGGFDRYYTSKNAGKDQLQYFIAAPSETETPSPDAGEGGEEGEGTSDTETTTNTNTIRYGMAVQVLDEDRSKEITVLSHRQLRPTGVATEIYNQIVSALTTQCDNINGRFIETQFIKNYLYSNNSNLCIWKPNIVGENEDILQGRYQTLAKIYGISYEYGEDMCPRSYNLSVDTKSWGVCSCWENGGWRSKNGKSATCLPLLPVSVEEGQTFTPDSVCNDPAWKPLGVGKEAEFGQWCTQQVNVAYMKTCPYRYKLSITSASGAQTDQEEGSESQSSNQAEESSDFGISCAKDGATMPEGWPSDDEVQAALNLLP